MSYHRCSSNVFGPHLPSNPSGCVLEPVSWLSVSGADCLEKTILSATTTSEQPRHDSHPVIGQQEGYSLRDHRFGDLHFSQLTNRLVRYSLFFDGYKLTWGTEKPPFSNHTPCSYSFFGAGDVVWGWPKPSDQGFPYVKLVGGNLKPFQKYPLSAGKLSFLKGNRGCKKVANHTHNTR